MTAALQADPSRSFAGTLQEILPQVNAATRTLQARFELDNKAGTLTPGMLLRLQIGGASAARPVVPAEAVIRTGTRRGHRAQGRRPLRAREIQLGADFGETLEVTAGLSEGEQVVASGQFLVDSEARLRSVLGSLAAAPAASAASAAPPATHMAQGRSRASSPTASPSPTARCPSSSGRA